MVCGSDNGCVFRQLGNLVAVREQQVKLIRQLDRESALFEGDWQAADAPAVRCFFDFAAEYLADHLVAEAYSDDLTVGVGGGVLYEAAEVVDPEVFIVCAGI